MIDDGNTSPSSFRVESPEEAFAALGHPLRLDILRTLWEHHDLGDEEVQPREPDPVPYSELLRRLGLRDHGQLNYHLNQLVGRFVRRTGDGYRLTGAGRALAVAVVEGSMVEYPALEPTEASIPCPLCAAPVVVDYVDGVLRVSCSECPGFGQSGEYLWGGSLWNSDLPPNCFENRTPEEVVAVMLQLNLLGLQARVQGTCPGCTGTTRLSVDACTDHRPAENGRCDACGRNVLGEFVVRCESCRAVKAAPVGYALCSHPAVVAFYHRHGIDLRSEPQETIRRVHQYEEELLSEDPLRLRVTIPAGDDTLVVVLDETLQVVSASND